MSKQARVRHHRRDRRKAKQSNWRREPKRKMNGAVAHGGSGSLTIQGNKPAKTNGKAVKEDRIVRTVGDRKPPTLISQLWEGKDELMGIWQDLQEQAIEDYNEAFDQGFFAYWHDIAFHENPYGSLEHGHPRFEEQFKAWRKGWNAAEKEIMQAKRDEEPIA